MMQGEGSVGVGGVGQAGAKAVVFRRVLTRKGHDPLDLVKWGWRKVELTEKGQLVFSADVEAPLDWDDLAVTIVAAKYMRKRGATKLPGGAETSVRQVLVRIAYALAEQALVQGVFGPPSAGPVADDPRAEMHDIFRDELLAAMLLQMCAFNSPVWFNVGLDRYGVTAKTTNFRWDEASGRAVPAEDAYACPQGSACFIQSIPDSLEGIFGLVQNESRVFRHGSGTGTNFSPLRGRQEKLSGGGNSSGLMSFLDVFDRAAGATKSGGTTRRAAKMVVLDMDHPEIVDFIEWKAREERKMSCLVGGGFTGGIEGEAARTVSGQNSNNSIRVTDVFMSSVDPDGEWPCPILLIQPDYKWLRLLTHSPVSVLSQFDVLAHLRDHPSVAVAKQLFTVATSTSVYYRLRMDAISTLAICATSKHDWIGLELLGKMLRQFAVPLNTKQKLQLILRSVAISM